MFKNLWRRLERNNLIYKIVSLAMALLLWLFIAEPFPKILP